MITGCPHAGRDAARWYIAVARVGSAQMYTFHFSLPVFASSEQRNICSRWSASPITAGPSASSTNFGAQGKYASLSKPPSVLRWRNDHSRLPVAASNALSAWNIRYPAPLCSSAKTFPPPTDTLVPPCHLGHTIADARLWAIHTPTCCPPLLGAG